MVRFRKTEPEEKYWVVLEPASTAGIVPADEEARPFLRKGIMMKSFSVLVLIATLCAFAVGCESQKGTTENKTQTTQTQTKDGKVTGQTTTTTTDATKTTRPVAPGTGGATTEKTTETTTETTK
jgi:hypothetical protein